MTIPWPPSNRCVVPFKGEHAGLKLFLRPDERFRHEPQLAIRAPYSGCSYAILVDRDAPMLTVNLAHAGVGVLTHFGYSGAGFKFLAA